MPIGGIIAGAVSRKRTEGRHSGRPVSVEGAVLFGISMIVGLIGGAITKSPVPPFAGFLIGLFFLLSVKVADQWEKVAVLRLGL